MSDRLAFAAAAAACSLDDRFLPPPPPPPPPRMTLDTTYISRERRRGEENIKEGFKSVKRYPRVRDNNHIKYKQTSTGWSSTLTPLL
jgi:hypothetical protein